MSMMLLGAGSIVEATPVGVMLWDNLTTMLWDNTTVMIWS
jgi:hypothetical protein